MTSALVIVISLVVGGFVGGLLTKGFMKRDKEWRWLYAFGFTMWVITVGALVGGIYLVIYGVQVGPEPASPSGTLYAAIGGIMMVAAGLLGTLSTKLEQERVRKEPEVEKQKDGKTKS